MQNIDNQVKEIHEIWEKSKADWQNFYILLSHLSKLQKAIVDQLREKDTKYSEASEQFTKDLEKYQAHLKASYVDLLKVEDEYKRLLSLKDSSL